MEETETLKPTDAQIKQTIQDIKKRLQDPAINKPVNRAIKEGYTEVVNILVECRQKYDGIDQLSTLQGRAIAVLGVDYLNGECTNQILTGVPLRAK